MSEALRDSQIKMLWTARIDYAKNSVVSEHAHTNFNQLLVVLEGAIQLTTDDSLHQLSEQDCCLIPAGTKHGFLFERETITLDFKFAVTDPRLSEALPPFLQVLKYAKDTLHELKQIFKLSMKQHGMKITLDPLSLLRIDTWFKSILLGLLVPSPSVSGMVIGKHEPFRMASYLEENLERQITLQELADQFNFHPHYIIELFRNHTGMTPIRYHQNVRLLKVKEWLEFTNLTVSEIANRVGWSLPYLSRLFQAQEGMTASDYRNYVLQAVNQDVILEDAFVNQWRIVHGAKD
ncbi:AraC family transcriptional regulator [Paenibacillus sp. LMG 31461]|uniref:AraC family transcriptional regulator n=1 Tax=Paenibacillus plantarum TaxID=2654975 RepID=A0ABX1X3A0_9BACL|nr:AraC family transcriptional regulator [Paenibacillus plantarum]NOU62784.1 AraC family transcriptional regulator [Paenibacillus plantarum]